MKKIPFAAQWTIAEEDLLKLKDDGDYKCLDSTYVSTSFGVKYCFEICPNGNEEANHGKVFIFFAMDIGNLRKVEAKYTVRIASANFYKEREVIYEQWISWGVYFCDTVELFDAERKFIVDEKMVLTVDGIFEIKDDADDDSPDGLEWDGNKLGGELCARNDTKDFLLTPSDGKGIKAHKNVLQAQSPVFAAMYRSNMKKAKKNQVETNDSTYDIIEIALFVCMFIMAIFNVPLNNFYYLFNYKSKRAMKEAVENQVEINDFSSDAIERALKLVYDYHGDFGASPEEAMSILQFLDKYDFPSVKERIEELLMNSVNRIYVCKLMNCAIKSNALKLQEKCFQFLITAVASKIPIADLEILDKEVLFKIVRHSLYQHVKTNK